MNKLACFKAYDVRGKLGTELNEDIAYRIGRAYAQVLTPKKVAVGGDVRLTSESLKQALAKGLMDGGADVVDIGLSGTEEIYFAAFHLDVDGGIEVTASHNPMDYNGMKFVGRGAVPISRDSGLSAMQALAETQDFQSASQTGRLEKVDILADYVTHLLGYIDLTAIKPLKVVVNAGNGAAGHVVNAIEQKLADQHIPITFIKINNEPDGNFPRGIPNPLLPECRQDTIDAILQHQADLGIAWDGDFDRCFLFDHEGGFIEGYYIVGLLAQAFLKHHPGEKIIYDPRLTWNTEDMVKNAGGIAIQSKTGHAFIKERMRAENAIYGGEMSAHHYFRDFAYCDSGMIPWLMIIELLSDTGMTLKDLVKERMALHPCSGEINFIVDDAKRVLQLLEERYAKEATKVEHVDGLSMDMDAWRFNVRASNTEPLLRLNVESHNDTPLMNLKTAELSALIQAK